MGTQPSHHMESTSYTSLNSSNKDDPLLAPSSSIPTASLVAPADFLNLAGGSPAYKCVEGLLTSSYRISSASELNAIETNAGRCANLLCCFFRCCGVRTFEVPQGSVKLAEDGRGKYQVYGPGVHRVHNPFMSIGETLPLSNDLISNGDRTIVTVKQGHIGYCEDMGQPVLLPPGLHEWQSQTLHFQEHVDLNNTLIKLGPYTILTVDEGYCAVTQNNGRQIILDGGQTHLLNHRNWKFEKFMSQKIQTNELQRIEATSADNVMMHTDATVVWRISKVDDAAKFSAETMRHDGRDNQQKGHSDDIQKLRNDVLKQATASLAAFIGDTRYSDSFHISAAGSNVVQAMPVNNSQSHPNSDVPMVSPIFDGKRMASAVVAANAITQSYGVTILSINIIAAVPADKTLQQALAKGAVASADAERAETVAHGDAKAVLIRAEADAEAERIRAAGAKEAAELLSTNSVAVDLAKITKIGEALQGAGSNTMFFGSDASALGNLMSNPAVVNAHSVQNESTQHTI